MIDPTAVIIGGMILLILIGIGAAGIITFKHFHKKWNRKTEEERDKESLDRELNDIFSADNRVLVLGVSIEVLNKIRKYYKLTFRETIPPPFTVPEEGRVVGQLWGAAIRVMKWDGHNIRPVYQIPFTTPNRNNDRFLLSNMRSMRSDIDYMRDSVRRGLGISMSDVNEAMSRFSEAFNQLNSPMPSPPPPDIGLGGGNNGHMGPRPESYPEGTPGPTGPTGSPGPGPAGSPGPNSSKFINPDSVRPTGPGIYRDNIFIKENKKIEAEREAKKAAAEAELQKKKTDRYKILLNRDKESS